MKRPHLQSHVTLRRRGHVTNKKSYIYTFTRPMYPNLSKVVTQDERTLPTKSGDSSISWSRGKMKNVISPLSQGLCTPDLGGWWLRIREPHPQSHLTDQPLGHVTTQRRYVFTFISPMDPKLRYQLLCGYYDRSLRRRKLADSSISLFLSFFVKKIIIYLMLKKPSGCNGKLVLVENKRKNANQN